MSDCNHERTLASLFRFRDYTIRGKICDTCHERFYTKEDLDKIPVGELENFLAEVKAI